jgi:Fe-Mn family superoxide dismutase
METLEIASPALALLRLPYARDALEPHMSSETLDYHYGKHHKTYVETANKLIAGTEFEQMELEDIVRKSSGKLFNNVAQVWNHNFFWNCLSPKPLKPQAATSAAISRQFGGLTEFKKQFTQAALDNFGSGWTWLVENPGGSLAIISTQGANNPLTSKQTALLTCDIWEHAYYIDYRNARNKYLEHFWSLANWDFVERNLGQRRE